jgi:hypothetical protein
VGVAILTISSQDSITRLAWAVNLRIREGVV